MINLNNAVEDIKVEMGTASRSRTGLSSGRLDPSTQSFAAYMWKACIDVTCLSNHISLGLMFWSPLSPMMVKVHMQGFLRVRCYVCAGSKCLVSFFSCKHTPSESQRSSTDIICKRDLLLPKRALSFRTIFVTSFLVASLIAGTLNTERASMLGFL